MICSMVELGGAVLRPIIDDAAKHMTSCGEEGVK